MSGTQLPFVQVDAFADAPFTGNPAAVMALDRWLPDDVLQSIAAENNLAETAFTVPLSAGEGADYALRWFTPTVEIALCGHATLASGHVLIGDRALLRFRTMQAGDLVVARADAGALAMRLPDWGAVPKPRPDLAAMLGGECQLTLWREGGYMVCVYRDEAAVRALAPDLAAMRAAGSILFIATAPGESTDIVSRVFAPGAGVDEDSVTGSAHCVIARYWADRLGRASFSARQASARGGLMECRLDEGSDGQSDGVILTGRCRTVITGDFWL
ncbi:MAG: PhzF family phenazine biosynthesis protein [Sphingobium sp.]